MAPRGAEGQRRDGGAAEDARRLLEDVRRGHESGCPTFEHLERLEAELGVLWRRVEQIRARDYFGTAETTEIDDVLRCCEDALSAFEAAAAGSDEAVP
jgi:hypothetical protein